MKYKFLWIPFVFVVLGCGFLSQAIPPTSTVQVPSTTIPSDTPALSPTIPATNKPTASAQGLAGGTPASSGNQMPGFMNNMNNVGQYLNPVGQPVKSWNDVPIMSQATAAQEWNKGVYSYKAGATLDQAVSFYGKFNPSGSFQMPPGRGSAGTGTNAIHNATFFYSDLLIYILSYDNDPSHVIVVISK